MDGEKAVCTLTQAGQQDGRQLPGGRQLLKGFRGSCAQLQGRLPAQLRAEQLPQSAHEPEQARCVVLHAEAAAGAERAHDVQQAQRQLVVACRLLPVALLQAVHLQVPMKFQRLLTPSPLTAQANRDCSWQILSITRTEDLGFMSSLPGSINSSAQK